MIPRRPKYGNHRTARGFASKREECRYDELVLLQKAGKITGLETQVTFRLLINGFLICKYIADATYFENGAAIVEDTKSPPTRKNPVYVLKKKLMKAIHNIEIREV